MYSKAEILSLATVSVVFLEQLPLISEKTSANIQLVYQSFFPVKKWCFMEKAASLRSQLNAQVSTLRRPSSGSMQKCFMYAFHFNTQYQKHQVHRGQEVKKLILVTVSSWTFLSTISTFSVSALKSKNTNNYIIKTVFLSAFPSWPQWSADYTLKTAAVDNPNRGSNGQATHRSKTPATAFMQNSLSCLRKGMAEIDVQGPSITGTCRANF